jgi:hypothetical protein
MCYFRSLTVMNIIHSSIEISANTLCTVIDIGTIKLIFLVVSRVFHFALRFKRKFLKENRISSYCTPNVNRTY